MTTAHAIQPTDRRPIDVVPAAAPARSRDCLHLVLEPVSGGERMARAATAALGALPGTRPEAADRTGLPGPASHRVPLMLRNPDLVADLRRIRAERFHDVYAQLTLRRRRAQIAARRMLT
jgi:hypothetical protein